MILNLKGNIYTRPQKFLLNMNLFFCLKSCVHILINHYAIRAIGAMQLRISEHCVSFSPRFSSRFVDLLKSIIYDIKRYVDLRWLFDPVLHSSLDDLVWLWSHCHIGMLVLIMVWLSQTNSLLTFFHFIFFSVCLSFPTFLFRFYKNSSNVCQGAVFLLIILLALFGNLLVIVSVLRTKNLR